MFIKDLKESQQQENELASIFQHAGYTVTTTQSEGNYSDYDLKVVYTSSKKESTIELKFDILAAKTQNVAVELNKTIKGKTQDSGLSATKADYIVYKFPDLPHFYGLPTEDLKYLIETKKYKKLVTGGDGKRVNLALFDRQVFINNCIIFNKENLR